MEQRIEPKIVLLAAEKIRRLGVSKGDAVVWQQVSLNMSYDGYTISVSNANASISLFFHNKVKADYRKMHELEAFYEQLQKIARFEEAS